MRRLVASALALLLAATFVACTAVISYDSDRDPEFQLLLTTFGGPEGSTPMLLFISIETGSALGSVTLPEYPFSVLAAPDGRKAYVGTTQGVLEIDGRTRTATQIPGSPGGGLLAISPDGRSLLLVTGGREVTVYDLQLRTSLEVPVNAAPNTGAFTVDGTALVPDWSGGLLLIPRDRSPRRLSTPAWAVAAHPTAAVAAVVTTGPQLLLLSTCDGSVLASDVGATVQGPLAFLPDGTRLLSRPSDSGGGLAVSSVVVPTGTCPTSASLTSAITFPSSAVMNQVRIVPRADSREALITAIPDLTSFGVGIYSAASGTYREVTLGNDAGSYGAVFVQDTAYVASYGAVYAIPSGASTGSVFVDRTAIHINVLRR